MLAIMARAEVKSKRKARQQTSDGEDLSRQEIKALLQRASQRMKTASQNGTGPGQSQLEEFASLEDTTSIPK